MAENSPASANCPFCRIVSRADDPPDRLGGGKSWLAFTPLQPATRGHTLIVPRVHIPHFLALEPALGSELSAACVAVGKLLERVLRPEGMNLITSYGTAAEQTIEHLHMHLVPRWSDDDFGPIWRQDGAARPLSERELAAIRAGLA